MTYLLAFAGAALLSWTLTPHVARLASRLQAVDHPNPRKIHLVAIPRLGGVALALAVLGTVLGGLAVDAVAGPVFGFPMHAWVPIWTGALVIFAVGVWDDLYSLPAVAKFLGQSLAAGLAMALGVTIEDLSIFQSGRLELGLLALPLTFVWIVGITNAFNLLDGLDGLAAGLASITAGTCAAIFLLQGNGTDALLLFMILGALVGFLPYNFNPARIFLGDSGSLVLGYVLAVIALMGAQRDATALAVVIPLLAFGLPVFDTLLSMARRLIGGIRLLEPYKSSTKARIQAAKRMFEADRGHVHHRLLAMGFSHRNAVLLLYGIAAGLSMLALLSVLAQHRNAGLILLTVGLATVVGIRKLGYQELVLFQPGMLLSWYERFAFNRRFFLAFVDVLLITAAYWAAYGLKYGPLASEEVFAWYEGVFPLVLLFEFGSCLGAGLYRGVWRAAGIGDFLRIGLAAGLGVTLSAIVVQLDPPPQGLLAFFCIQWLVLGFFLVGVRSVYRVLDHCRQRGMLAGTGVLIYGAGRGGQLVLRELLQNRGLGMRPLGFIDDDVPLHGRRVNQFPVLGSHRDLTTLLAAHPIGAVVVSSEKIPPVRVQAVVGCCAARGIRVLHAHLKFESLDTASAMGRLGARSPRFVGSLSKRPRGGGDRSG